jgi:transposase-like protein
MNDNTSPEVFRQKLDKFRAETQMSMAATGRLLDVAPGTMVRWWKDDTENGKPRQPQGYVQASIEMKIDRLNVANGERGVYAELRGLKPAERVALLQSVLDSGHYS